MFPCWDGAGGPSQGLRRGGQVSPGRGSSLGRACRVAHVLTLAPGVPDQSGTRRTEAGRVVWAGPRGGRVEVKGDP